MYSLRDASGGFCPTAEEILAQIPDRVVDRVIAFTFPPVVKAAPGSDYLIAQVLLYQAG